MSGGRTPDGTEPPVPGSHSAESRNAASHSAAALSVGAGATAGVAALFLVLRLLAVSDWDWSTTAAVADTVDFSDVIPIVLGTLLAEPGLTGILLAVMLPVTVGALIWPSRATGGNRTLTGMILPAVLVAATVTWMNTYRQWWLPVVAVLIGVVFVVLRLAVHHGIAHDVSVTLTRRIGVVGVIGVLVMATVVSTPWMEHERFTTADGTMTGYVLNVESGYVRVLTEDRDVVILDSDEIRKRTILE